MTSAEGEVVTAGDLHLAIERGDSVGVLFRAGEVDLGVRDRPRPDGAIQWFTTPCDPCGSDGGTGVELLFDATVEPDVDSDGMGDESQDEDGGGLGFDWVDDWFADFDGDGLTSSTTPAPRGARTLALLDVAPPQRAVDRPEGRPRERLGHASRQPPDGRGAVHDDLHRRDARSSAPGASVCASPRPARRSCASSRGPRSSSPTSRADRPWSSSCAPLVCNTEMDFADFDALTFDCYGTLIDWETGISNALRPIAGDQRPRTLLEALRSARGGARGRAVSAVRRGAARVCASGWGRRRPSRRRAFGQSVRDWPAFPDSPEALARLKTRFKLGVITNCDDDLFAASNEKLGVEFDWVITAEQARGYKPRTENFEFAFERIDVPRERILHVAQIALPRPRPGQGARHDDRLGRPPRGPRRRRDPARRRHAGPHRARPQDPR